MIERVEGTITQIKDHLVELKAGPLSFGLLVPNAQTLSLSTNMTLLAHLHWNQENGPTLYGFTSVLDKQVFILIIGCNGIGPKLGLTILNELSAQGFLQAIQTHDDTMLSKVSGIGAKKAENIIVQLKHKVNKLLSSGIDLGDNASLAAWRDVDQALSSLNYSRPEIARTLAQLKQESDSNTLSFDKLLRRALTLLAQK